MNIKLSKLLEHRYCIMGIASLWIMFYHSDITIPFISIIKETGYGAVDIFFFLSGLGCYRSLNKNNSIPHFIKKRSIRIFPPYYLCLLFAIIVEHALGIEISIKSIIQNIFCISYLCLNSWLFVWYITALWISYLLAPYLKSLADKTNKKWHFIAIVCLLFLFSTSFWSLDQYIIIFSRIPIFFIGMCIGKLSINDFIITEKHLLYSTIYFIIGCSCLTIAYLKYPNYLWAYGLYWYPFILISPPFCLYLALIIEKIRVLKKLEILGKFSFEIYLIHHEILIVIRTLNIYGSNSTLNSILCFTALLCTFPLCFLLNTILKQTIFRTKIAKK